MRWLTADLELVVVVKDSGLLDINPANANVSVALDVGEEHFESALEVVRF